MKQIKKESGITLVALVTTIVVLLILAIVTVGIINDDGTIELAQNATSDYEMAKVEKDIKIAILENDLKSSEKLAVFLKQKYGDANVETNSDGTYTITLENGYKCIVLADGTVSHIEN